jgi:hypothetical protein
MDFFALYDRIVTLAAEPAHAARVAEMRQVFEACTGAFGPLDPWFEVRSRAFWDDALTRQGFAREPALPPEARPWVDAMDRAHRGLFRVDRRDSMQVLVDLWSGAEFVVTYADASSRAALQAAAGLFDARLVGLDDPVTLVLLPGALFHPEDATLAIETVLVAARASGIGEHDVFDALLRMERNFRSLSRVKASYAYRPEALRAH